MPNNQSHPTSQRFRNFRNQKTSHIRPQRTAPARQHHAHCPHLRSQCRQHCSCALQRGRPSTAHTPSATRCLAARSRHPACQASPPSPARAAASARALRSPLIRRAMRRRHTRTRKPSRSSLPGTYVPIGPAGLPLLPPNGLLHSRRAALFLPAIAHE